MLMIAFSAVSSMWTEFKVRACPPITASSVLSLHIPRCLRFRTESVIFILFAGCRGDRTALFSWPCLHPCQHQSPQCQRGNLTRGGEKYLDLMEWAVSLLKSYSYHIKIDSPLLLLGSFAAKTDKTTLINNRSSACSSFAWIWAAGYVDWLKRTMQACFESSEGTAAGQGTVSAARDRENI